MAKSFLLAFIGGSGLYQIEDLKNQKWINIKTPWGSPSDRILSGTVNNNKVLFLPRHGRSHIYNPSEINYRANIYALKKLGATDIISLSACGSLKENLSPGTFVLVDQFIDKTITRKKTFFEDGIVAHVPMSQPTSKILMKTSLDLNRKQIVEELHFLESEGFYDMCLRQNLEIGKRDHPLEEAHRQMAVRIISDIKTNEFNKKFN